MLWPFDYYRPTTIDEVGELLRQCPGAELLAGGTNLIIDMEHGVRRPPAVVDLKGVQALQAIERQADGSVWVGAAVPLNRLVEKGAGLPWTCLQDAVLATATYQVRNRATAVGNLCNASPAADMAPPLLALGITVQVQRADGGVEQVPLDGFFTGPKAVALQPGDWVRGLVFPPAPATVRTAFFKKQRVRGHDLAQVNTAALCCPERRKLRLAVGACAPTPLLFDLDGLCAEAMPLSELVVAADRLVQAAIAPLSDLRASAPYRRAMARRFGELALAAVCGPAAKEGAAC